MENKPIPFFTLEGIDFFIDYIKNRVAQTEYTNVWSVAFEWVKRALCDEAIAPKDNDDAKLYAAWSAAESNHHAAKVRRDAMLMTVWRYTMVAVDSYRNAALAAV